MMAAPLGQTGGCAYARTKIGEKSTKSWAYDVKDEGNKEVEVQGKLGDVRVNMINHR